MADIMGRGEKRIPNKHKARNQVAAGFESVFFWWATINKNVDWINYIYYNQQRFVNFTTDAIKGLKVGCHLPNDVSE